LAINDASVVELKVNIFSGYKDIFGQGGIGD